MKLEFPTTEDINGPLFYDVHQQRIFEDGKTFADARALLLPSIIIKKDEVAKAKGYLDLRAFVKQYFELPNDQQKDWKADTSNSA